MNPRTSPWAWRLRPSSVYKTPTGPRAHGRAMTARLAAPMGRPSSWTSSPSPTLPLERPAAFSRPHGRPTQARPTPQPRRSGARTGAGTTRQERGSTHTRTGIASGRVASSPGWARTTTPGPSAGATKQATTRRATWSGHPERGPAGRRHSRQRLPVPSGAGPPGRKSSRARWMRAPLPGTGRRPSVLPQRAPLPQPGGGAPGQLCAPPRPAAQCRMALRRPALTCHHRRARTALLAPPRRKPERRCTGWPRARSTTIIPGRPPNARASTRSALPCVKSNFGTKPAARAPAWMLAPRRRRRAAGRAA